MRLSRLYTRTGDDGTTRLADGQEVRKDSARVAAYGAVDELNAWLGVALAGELDASLRTPLVRLQNQLFDLGADLATPRGVELGFEVPRIPAEAVDALEAHIDELTEATGPLENFVLPGGDAGAATLHVARTVCRRAERAVITLAAEAEVGEVVIPFLNRLSDLLFAMSRLQNQASGVPEPLWQPGSR